VLVIVVLLHFPLFPPLLSRGSDVGFFLFPLFLFLSASVGECSRPGWEWILRFQKIWLVVAVLHYMMVKALSLALFVLCCEYI